MQAAVSDFVDWEPGKAVVCVLCGRERGGADPPGPWIRNRQTHRRRMPIFHWSPLYPLGYLEYVYA
jgi:hypothetical protein